jgi:hypothetical protein
MPVTKEIASEQLEMYFAEFTRRFLTNGYQKAADVEVLEPEMGSQLPVEGARLLGISFDPRTRALEIEFDFGDHRIVDFADVWTVEEPDGFLSYIAVHRGDGSRELVTIKRVGLRRLH